MNAHLNILKTKNLISPSACNILSFWIYLEHIAN